MRREAMRRSRKSAPRAALAQASVALERCAHVRRLSTLWLIPHSAQSHLGRMPKICALPHTAAADGASEIGAYDTSG
jgi:hypothetical protein